MGVFLSYSIVAGLMMLATYLAYRLFLARENQHSFNRGVLLSIYFVSFIAIPLALWLENLNTGADEQPLVLNGFEITGIATTPLSKPVWGTVLIWAFLLGMATVTAKTIVTWIRLINVIRSGKKIEKDGYTLVITDNEKFAPFSWMRYIVISDKDYNNSCSAITAHELKHVDSRHWIDLLIAQIVCIINWFNPVAWLMREELMLIHEYQADMAVIDNGHDPQEYQMLLIKKAVGSRFPSLANSLNHSKLKKRITMMYKEKSGAGRKFKALALVPMFALALGVAAVPAVRAAVSTISNSEISVGKDSKNLPEDKILDSSLKVTNINDNGNETTVVIKGEGLGNNLSVSGGALTTNGNTCQAKSMQCEMTNGNATIKLIFPASGVQENQSMTLNINGKEYQFTFRENASGAIQKIATGSIPGTNTTITIKGSSSTIPEGMIVLIDNKQISMEEFNQLPVEKIESITVDRINNKLIITTK